MMIRFKKAFIVLVLLILNMPAISIDEESRLAWFKEAKFGLFIHWGPYSNLAGEWNGKQVPLGENAEWIMQKLKIPRDAYRELAKKFNPVKFDAAQWVNLAKSTGMKYLVITSKHHDGFAMYHSQVSKYNIVDWTPFDRDPLKELAQESRKAGIKFGIYYSHREDWDEPFAYGNTWDFDFDPEKNLDLFESRYLETKAKPQIRELISNYGPFGLIWFDRGLYTPEEAQDFVRLSRELQPDIIINGRVGNYNQELQGDYQNMNDNGMPIGGIEEYWETPQTLNETWGYSKFDTLWKSPDEVIRRLVEIVSAGGNYLLNVGPTGEGLIPRRSVEILHKVGEWMAENSEAIYATTPSPFPRLEWGNVTVKGNRLYLIVMRPPANGKIDLPGLNNRILSARPLNRPGESLAVNENLITLPENFQPKKVIVADLDGAPDVNSPVVSADEKGGYLLDYVSARTFGKVMKRFNRKGTFFISKWKEPQDYICWTIKANQPASYRLAIEYSVLPENVGKSLVIKCEGKTISHTLAATGDWYDFKKLDAGQISIPGPGAFKIIIAPGQSSDSDLVYFKSLTLSPVDESH